MACIMVPLGDNHVFYDLLAGSESQLVLTQAPSLSKPLGGTVTLSCRYSRGAIPDGRWTWWAQQTPGGKPRTVMHTTNTRPSDVPARFSSSQYGNVMSLTITGVQPEDEATYYCSLWTGSEGHSSSFGWQRETKTSFPFLALSVTQEKLNLSAFIPDPSPRGRIQHCLLHLFLATTYNRIPPEQPGRGGKNSRCWWGSGSACQRVTLEAGRCCCCPLPVPVFVTCYCEAPPNFLLHEVRKKRGRVCWRRAQRHVQCREGR
uniref:Ig-like domain-containing protein n=1 Tax=Varanus komodoensis TaxID=61221 RepID=A0A8D2KU09_VARKO